jgi:transposase-like protein
VTWEGTVALNPRTIGPRSSTLEVVRSTRRVAAPGSEFAGFRFPPEVITLAVRWYLRFGLSYRDVEELLAERGIEVDHVSVYRWGHCCVDPRGVRLHGRAQSGR